jgi:hypothetical protein
MRFASLITAVDVLISCGFSIVGLICPAAMLPTGSIPNQASFIFASYAAARIIPLALIALFVIYKQSRSALIVVGVLAGLVQLTDSLVGLYEHDVGKTLGPLVIGCLQLFAIALLTRRSRGTA